MKRRILTLALLLLAGCASTLPAPVSEVQSTAHIEKPRLPAPAETAAKTHVVKKGETLYGIAREHGLNPRDLAAWNLLDNTSRLVVGQTLRLTPPAAPAATPAPSPEAIEVRPIIGSGAVVARPLDGAAAGSAVPPAPTVAPSSHDAVKRAPKGGKLPYSAENLALLKGESAPPPAALAAPAPGKPAAPIPPVTSPAAATDSGSEWLWPANGKLLATFSDGNGGAQAINRGIDIAGKIGDPVRAAAAGKVIFVGVYPKHGNLVVLLHADGYSSVYAHNSRILVKEGQMVKRGDKIAELGDSDADQPKLHFELRHKGKPLDPLKLLPAR
ncbi:LysM peptidoglycan-binding domain-containing M23 family metallopeptidase [Sulfuricystis multivorans]|uniref:LysM peptidoglycan-binding domain-containing M23 family metallopeptidase n=1 Tax=Sulfuricystis multivorans TaxID=2211108 RepID=UPI000F843247|nr:peptidoglycan DD-metalloendopeptidase family protein [Sulfuricystis multivorans]